MPRTILCGDVLRGALTADDCKRIDGTPEDTFVFSGFAGQYIGVTVFTTPGGFHPDLTLVSPDGTTQYHLNGGIGGTALSQVLRSTGQWKLTLGTHDGLAPDYTIAFSCQVPQVQASNPSCIDQNFLCGQTVDSRLTFNNCSFFDDPGRLYDGGWISGVQGDTFTAVAESFDFPPQVRFYAENLGRAIAVSSPTSAVRDALTFQLPYTGRYFVLATSKHESPVRMGRYRLTIGNCAGAGCLPPLITEQPADVGVPFFGRATLSVTALGVGPLRYTWVDRSFLPEVAPTDGRRFTTPPITSRMLYNVIVSTPCGSAESRWVTVTPGDGYKHHPARH